jgi:hypothetical protein
LRVVDLGCEQRGGWTVSGDADCGTVNSRPHDQLAHASPGRELTHGVDPLARVGVVVSAAERGLCVEDVPVEPDVWVGQSVASNTGVRE